jgi:hypothetical protein
MTEYWLTGPIDGVPAFLAPAAATFLQVRHDATDTLSALDVERIWRRLGAAAPIGFHALHIAGATDRLLSYARGEQLTERQLAELAQEKTLDGLDAPALIARIETAVANALEQIRGTDTNRLLDPRGVGRMKLPSTTLGVIAHAAEHAYRHAGQMASLRRALTV